MFRRIASFTATLVLGASLAFGAASAERQTFIRDAELESIIRSFAEPVFRVAGLDPSAVEVYLVQDRRLNAFVAGGQKLFINTGLIMETDDASQLIGVIAHEAGHMAGGHLAQRHDALRRAHAEQILAAVLGAATALGTGRGDVGAAIAVGGQEVGVRNFLHYSRTQEYSADVAALKFMDALGLSAHGMMTFLQRLEDQELVPARHQDPYVRTHPITRERIELVEEHVRRESGVGPVSEAFAQKHRRMVAKLTAFLGSLSQTLRAYPEEDTSLPARYARAIAYFRKPDLDEGLKRIEALIAENPDDPYFTELKAQMLFEHGRSADAIAAYNETVHLAPHEPLIRASLARAQIESGDPALLESAVGHLRAALLHERETPSLWRDLAIAYGRQGDMGQSALALAEEALLKGNEKDARFQAEKAEKLLPAGSPGALHAQDILRATEKDEDKK